MQTASLPLVLFSVTAAVSAAAVTPSAVAGVRVEVDPGAPFTEADLADAVDIRTDYAESDGDVVIRVAKLGMDQLIVIVGDRSQVITLEDRDRTASSRVVALVVTALLGDESTTGGAFERPVATPAVAASQPELMEPAPPPVEPHTAFLAKGTVDRDDNGYWIPYVHLGVVRPVAPSVRLIGSLGLGRYEDYRDTKSMLFPLRVGVEGRAGAAGIEFGGQMIAYREVNCIVPEWGHHESAYGAGKIVMPAGQRSRIVVELGGYFVLDSSPTECNSAGNYTGYGGWFGAGFEWTP